MMQWTNSLLFSLLVVLLYPTYCLLSFWVISETQKSPATTICIPTVKRETVYLDKVVYSFLHFCERYPHVAQNVQKVFIFQLDSHNFNPYWMEDSTIPFYCREKIAIEFLPQCFPAIDNMTYYQWRCKEAIDYARTMESCEKLADSFTNFFLLLQDDAVFNPHFSVFYEALSGWMQRSKWQRICSISLYDIKQRTDGGPLLSNNAVARLYRRNLLKNLSAFIKSQYRKQPVDGLIEEYCKKVRLTTFVKVPNPIHHIGNISTFRKRLQWTFDNEPHLVLRHWKPAFLV
ncbi:hypothetical protein GpartN1_g5991.t1 [Galdieria partita]|uniref:Uncharacterized protein n=1 Tax=Galdieria partita TaxID=83374 RepID=A0A9C7UT79_9RHOD|nr:hypothetical protein GpartN1_g5991.t1 [Galdieria partita]